MADFFQVVVQRSRLSRSYCFAVFTSAIRGSSRHLQPVVWTSLRTTSMRLYGPGWRWCLCFCANFIGGDNVPHREEGWEMEFGSTPVSGRRLMQVLWRAHQLTALELYVIHWGFCSYENGLWVFDALICVRCLACNKHSHVSGNSSCLMHLLNISLVWFSHPSGKARRTQTQGRRHTSLAMGSSACSVFFPR